MIYSTYRLNSITKGSTSGTLFFLLLSIFVSSELRLKSSLIQVRSTLSLFGVQKKLKRI